MAQAKWDFDPVHSSIGFSVRHLMVAKVKGQFLKWSGTLSLDEADVTNSEVEATIEAASIDTREPKRDEHLRSADFFDAANHPALAFESTRVEKLSAESYKVSGTLTIRGVAKPVVLVAEFLGKGKDPWGGTRLGFSARTSIDRRDFGLTFNIPLDGGGVVVGDKVDIEIEVEAVKAVAAPK